MTAGAGPGPGIEILEGMTIGPQPRRAGPPFQGQRMFVMPGRPGGAICLDDDTLSRHVLFLGGIGTGKTNAMQQLVAAIRRSAGPGDVLIVFDTKGDFRREFAADGDAVISADPAELAGPAARSGTCSATCPPATRRPGPTRSTRSPPPSSAPPGRARTRSSAPPPATSSPP